MKYYRRDQIKNGEISVTCSTQVNMTNLHKALVGKT
jgi:hypothetical protein